MKRLSLSIVLLFILFTSGYAQNVAPSWTSITREKGDNSDRFNKIVPDGFGNFIGVGYTIRSGNSRDFLTVKLRANGDTVWTKSKNGKSSGDDEAVSAGVDANGNVYVTGFSDEDVNQNDIRTIKYDSTGIVLWDTLWNSPAFFDDVPADLKIDVGGNCIIAGYAVPDTFSSSKDYITLKYEPDGHLAWTQQYSNPNSLHGKDEAAALALDSLDNVYVTGRSFDGINGTDDIVTIKYDGTFGTQSWLRTYNANFDDRATGIVADHAGSIIIGGSSGNGNNNDFRVIKYDLNGSPVWIKSYNAPANQDDDAVAIGVDANNNVIVSGESDIDNSPFINFDFQTVKYTSAGSFSWAVRKGNIYQQNDQPNAMCIDASGNIFITGKSDKNVVDTTADNDFMTVMYNASGALQWGDAKYYEGSRIGDDDIASSIVCDNLGNVYVAGGAVDTLQQKNATILKYDVASGNQTMVSDYNGEGDFRESVSSIVVDANNFSYVSGYTFAENNNLNGIIEKIDPNGNVVCTFIYKGKKNDDDEFNSIALSPNGNIYAAGYTKVLGQKSNMLLVKWDPNTCDTIWSWTYDYVGLSDKAASIVLDVAGNIYLTGRSDKNPNDTIDDNDIVTFKFDSNGNVLWTSPRYNGSGNLKDEPQKIILDNAGNVIVAGRSENVHDDDYVILKYNSSNGQPVWASPVIWASQHANDDRVSDVIVDAFDNIFVGGFAQQGSGNAAQEAVIQKYDSAGNNLTGAYLIGDDKDNLVRLAIDLNNNVYALYQFDADGGIPLANNFDFLLKKFDNELIELWAVPVEYDSPIHGDDMAADMAISPAGDIFITGSSENDSSAGRVNRNWVTLGYDNQGSQIFISNWDGPSATDDNPNAIVIRGQSMWVCGNSEGPNNNQKDITVNKYFPLPVNVSEINHSFRSFAFPNPFSNQCEVVLSGYDLKQPAYVQLYDLLGHSVMQEQIMTNNSVRIHRDNLSQGIYEYRIRSGNSIIAHGKLIINQ